MKRFFFSLIILFLLGGALFAQDHGFGLGIVLGEPTGLNFKLWLGGPSALDLSVAWTFFEPDQNSLQVYADYLFHFFGVFSLPSGRLVPYIGIGGRIIVFTAGNTLPVNIGVRVPVGLTYLFPGAPVDVFLEIVPIMALLPATRFQACAGIGVRYFF